MDMDKRVELDDVDVEGVVGGALQWQAGVVTVLGTNPPVQYHYGSYKKCSAWIRENWSGPQDESCLKKLIAAGLVW